MWEFIEFLLQIIGALVFVFGLMIGIVGLVAFFSGHFINGLIIFGISFVAMFLGWLCLTSFNWLS